MAASTASGIRLSSAGTVTTAASSSTPCRIAETFERAPDWMLAELRTMTCVTGSPPMRPEIDVAQALGLQLTIGRGDALERVELVGRFHAQQRFEAGDDGQRDRRRVDGRVGELAEVGPREQRQEARSRHSRSESAPGARARSPAPARP